MILENKYFKLFANCIPVKGATKSAIFDLERHVYIEIPNLLHEILAVNESRNYSLDALKNHFEGNYSEGINQYFNFLVEKGLGFFTAIPTCFPALDLAWDRPFEITNAIIEYSTEKKFDLFSCINQLESLGCQAVELRLFGIWGVPSILEILNHYQRSRIKLLSMVLDYYEGILKEIEEERLFQKSHRLSSLLVCSVPQEVDLKHVPSQVLMSHKSRQDLESEKRGVAPFVVNVSTFSEAQKFNLFFNKKVCIAKDGSVKNFFTQSKVFGNINSQEIATIINQTDFQEIWHFHNDEIEKCKDCQFRYACLDDSEVLIQNGQKIKKQDCGFNPVTNTWI